jgi:hypothetical protein
MSGESVCEMIASDCPGYAAGDIVLAIEKLFGHEHAPWFIHCLMLPKGSSTISRR